MYFISNNLIGIFFSPQMMDFIESEYLAEQVDDIKVLSDHITNLKRVGGGLGEYLFDRNLKS